MAIMAAPNRQPAPPLPSQPESLDLAAVQPHPSAPQWFRDAVARPWQPVRIQAEGAGVHARLYQSAPPDAPGLVLLHGGSAHSHWWSFIAGQLDSAFRVLCIDLPGMGDSDHRPEYGSRITANCVQAMCEEAGLRSRAQGGPGLYICGHSFGGFMTLASAHYHPELADGVVLVDSPISPPGQEFGGPPPEPHRKPKHYASHEEILGRFRLQPPQECHNDYIMDFIARHSVRRTPQGWRWKFDPNQYALMRHSEQKRGPRSSRDMLPRLRPKLHYIYGELSSLFPSMIADYATERVQAIGGGVTKMTGVHHHLLLEEPLAFTDLVRSVLQGWEAEA